jgi:DNA helicase-2/ATP-dependent DNA helicase PcrA
MQNYEETAILFRVNARTLLFERTFTQRRIPYKIVGALPFYKRKVVKDLLCYCKASLNPEDIESLVRVVNVPKRGFGETRQERLLLEGRPYLDKSVEEVPRIKSFIDLLEEIKNKSPLEAINTVLHQTDYRRTLTTDNDRFMVDSFLDVVSGFNSIEDLILASNFIEKDSGHGVKLMSAHASKGLEFDRVFVVGVEDGLWPHNLSENIEEESRLYYVSITRSKKWLNVSYSKSRICRGKKIDVLPSSLFIDSYKSFKK